MNKRTVGTRYEEIAARYLTEQGLVIVASNFRCRIGEIDLIALKKADADKTGERNTYVFVEVKYRRDARSGLPFEAVDHKKRKTICRVADYFRLIHGGLSGYDFRFDVISILGEEITWYPDAFPYTV